MKIPLSEFPNQPGALPCCAECKSGNRACVPNPMDCVDFYIQNLDFMLGKLKEA